MYTLQRVTGLILFAYIIVHVSSQRFGIQILNFNPMGEAMGPHPNEAYAIAHATMAGDTLYRKLNKYKLWSAKASLYLGIQLANLKLEGIRLSHRRSETRGGMILGAAGAGSGLKFDQARI